uniref:Metalloendopeptidase n=1 Tax=Sphaeramia orbicularis TaxID=375764 RepID=A0A672YR61_9TELE
MVPNKAGTLTVHAEVDLTDPVDHIGPEIVASLSSLMWTGLVCVLFSASRERSIIERGLLSFHDVTCIRFVRRTNQRDYLSIQSDSGCYSYVGRRGYSQTLSLDRQGCLYHSTVQHELLHALGFNHEQCRSDRDQHIRVLWQNIHTTSQLTEYLTFSNKLLTHNSNSSVSHPLCFPRYAFSGNNRPTMEPIPNANVEFGTASQMSKNDIDRVNRLYKC